jgi:hypothetical protein
MIEQFNPADHPRGGPRPPDLIDDPLDVANDEATKIAEQAINLMAKLSRELENDHRGLRQ